jgi:hypothetical protein
VSGTLDTVVSGDSENTFFRAEFPVNYAQFYVLDGNNERTVHPEPGAPGESHAGILRTVRGGALLYTGLYQGFVDLTVSVHLHEPDPLLAEYEDVVEVSLQVDTDTITVTAWESRRYFTLPPLPPGTGWYRLRYHARDMDRAHDLYSEVPIDAFHLQIWAASQRNPQVLKATSSRTRRKLSV